jgi:predicted ArsR family transcriptional regulator
MKRVITSVALLAIVAIACFCSFRYISRTTEILDQMTETVFRQTEAGQFEAAQQAMEQSYTTWRIRRRVLSALVRHNELDDIDRLYQRTRQALNNSDQDESLLQLRELRAMLRYLPEMEKPTYSNIL